MKGKFLINHIAEIKSVRNTRLIIIGFLALLINFFSCTEEKIGPSASAFLKYYGSLGIDELNIAEVTSSGKYILLGSSKKNTPASVTKQMCVLLTDDYGIKTNENLFGGEKTSEGRALKETQEGDFILLGDIINADNSSDLYLVKVDKNLESKWETIISLPSTNEKGFAVTILPDGSYFILGTSSTSDGNSELITTIVYPDGTYNLPSKPGFTQRQDYVGKSVVLRPNGRLAWCWTQFRDMEHKDPNTSDIGLVFSNEEGISDQGDFAFGRKRNDFAADIQKASTGYILLGTSESVSGEGSKIYLAKTSDNGTLQWERIIGATSVSGNERASSIYPTHDGGYIILGTTDVSLYPNQEGQNLFLVKTNSTGEVEWEEVYGGKGEDEAATVRQTADGGYVVAATIDLNGDRTMCLIKTNSRGKIID